MAFRFSGTSSAFVGFKILSYPLTLINWASVDKEKANKVFYDQMKKTLTPEQFKKWENSLKK